MHLFSSVHILKQLRTNPEQEEAFGYIVCVMVQAKLRMDSGQEIPGGWGGGVFWSPLEGPGSRGP